MLDGPDLIRIGAHSSVYFGSISANCERQLWVDSVEKIEFLELPKDWLEKPPFSTHLREISA
jgi:hypothetical protein